MVRQCVACGFAADTTVMLPETWVSYLIEERGFEDIDQNTDLPVCIGCQRTVAALRDPKHPKGSKHSDLAVRAFLNDINQPQQDDQPQQDG